MNMDHAAAVVADETADLDQLVDDAEDAIAVALRAILALQGKGIGIIEHAGIPVGLVGQLFGFAGRANAGISNAAEAMQGVRACFHEAVKRLTPSDPTIQSGGGGGKEPPPKP